MSNQNKQLYIVISQTGTLLSRILKQITGAEYNHASISLSRDLERMYSFGRRHPYNPFWGGFVIESPRTDTFKRFSETSEGICEDATNRTVHRDCHNSRQGGAWSSICNGVVLIRRRGFCFLHS